MANHQRRMIFWGFWRVVVDAALSEEHLKELYCACGHVLSGFGGEDRGAKYAEGD